MADLVLTGALTTEQLGDVVFNPLTEGHNPGVIDTITPSVISGPGTTTVDPTNPLIYTVDAVSEGDSVIEYDIDMQPGADIRSFKVQLHLTGTAPGTVSIDANFGNVRLKS